MSYRLGFAALPIAAALALAGCMTRPPAPVDERVPAQGGRSAPLLPPITIVPKTPEAPAPVPTYVVKRGDTLHQIALDSGLDYRELAAWNNVENPNVIRVGQVLRLTAPGDTAAEASGVVVTPLKVAPPVAADRDGKTPPPFAAAGASAASGHPNTAAYKSEPKAVKLPYSDQVFAQLQRAPSSALPPAAPPPTMERPALAPSVAAGPPPGTAAASAAPAASSRAEDGRVPEIDDDKLGWSWPATGRVIGGFSENANLKGIDIAGKAGQPVLASAAGKVVYAGSGLRGYGKLIIIKHNKTYLSAYAHNREILVKEGQQVAKGQQVAEMGDSDSDQVKLHFEIRRLGKPIDPTKFLPPA
jgi:lipoprotein NlpD